MTLYALPGVLFADGVGTLPSEVRRVAHAFLVSARNCRHHDATHIVIVAFPNPNRP
jgi:hypothetical protein